MSFFSKLFSGKGSAVPRKDDGLDEEHVQLRRAIERCDALRPAYDVGQLKLDGIVDILKRSDFSATIIRKAVAESLGEDAASRIRL